MMYLIGACIAAGFLGLVVGAVWYNPKVFGTAWMDELGITEADAQNKNMVATFAIAFIITAYMAYEMKWVNHPDEKFSAFIHGMYHGVRHIGVFAIGAVIINSLFEGRSPKLIAINAGYWFVVFGLIGGMLASFPSFKEKPAETETTEETTSWNIEESTPAYFSYNIEQSSVVFK